MKKKRMLIVFVALLGCVTARSETPAPVMEQFPMDLVQFLMDIPEWTPLIKEDLSNAAVEPDGWAFDKGVLTAKGKGDIWTKERYGNFMLNVEFKCEEKTNSGIFIRCGDMKDWLHSSMEIQILQNNQDYENPKHHCGGLFDCKEPVKILVKKPGEWNNCIIVAKDKRLYVLLNGEQVLGVNLDQWTEPHKNPDGTPNKFKNAYKDMPLAGFIGLQYHGQPIAFRNLRIKPLD